MKNVAIAFAALLLAAGASAPPALAHHSAAVFYRLDRQVTLEGVVQSYTLANPHAQIYLTVTAPNGAAQEWLAEGGSRTALLRNGWTGAEVAPGDRLTIVGNPARDGSNVVHWQKVVLANGKALWGEDLPTPDEPEASIPRSAH